MSKKKAKEYSPEFKFKIIKELLRQESTQTEISQREASLKLKKGWTKQIWKFFAVKK